MSAIDPPQQTPPGSDASPSPLYCVYCGKRHPDDATFCPITGKPLDRADWARDPPADDQSLAEAKELASASVSSGQSTGPQEPVPPLPDLPARAKDQPTAVYVKSWRILIPDMGDRADEIAARFFAVLADRGIKGLRLSLGQIVIPVADGQSDSRDYFFAELDLGNSALATMAVRIAPFGRDLFVEWRHLSTPGFGPKDFSDTIGFGLGMTLCGSIVALPIGIPILVLAWMIWAVTGPHRVRNRSLEGFQSQESTAFQLSVSKALEKAIDLAGISKDLFQELRDDDDQNRRVI